MRERDDDKLVWMVASGGVAGASVPAVFLVLNQAINQNVPSADWLGLVFLVAILAGMAIALGLRRRFATHQLGMASLVGVLIATVLVFPLLIAAGIWLEPRLNLPYLAYAGALFWSFYGVAAIACWIAAALIGALVARIFSRSPRGNANDKVAARMPVRPLAAAGLLTVLLVFLVTERDDLVNLAVSWLPETEINSPWLAHERQLFRDVLSKRRYNVLVLPFAAQDFAAVDRVARSMMMRRLVDRLSHQSSLQIADPSLVLRALGRRARAYSATDAQSLAKRVGARWILSGVASRSNHAMSIVLTLQHSGSGETTQRTWNDIAFSDEDPPEEAFRRKLDEILAWLPVELMPPPSNQRDTDGNADQEALSVPDRALALALQPSESPVVNAMRLQLFALFHVRREMEQEELWTRSLIALDGVSEDSPMHRLTRSRALFHLHRRPAALVALGEPQSGEEKAFLAIMRAHLITAQQLTYEIKSPLARWLALCELENLHTDLGLAQGYEKRREKLFADHPDYAALAWLRFSTSDGQHPEVPRQVQRALEASNVLSSWEPYREGLDQAASVAWRFNPYSSTYADGFRIERSHDRLWRDKGSEWSVRAGQENLRPSDYFDLLFANNRFALLNEAYTEYDQKAAYESGVSKVKALNQLYAGHPHLTWYYCVSLQHDAVDSKTRRDRSDYWQKLARAVYQWEGNESPDAFRAEALLQGIAYEKYLDEPPSEHQPFTEALSAQVPSTVSGTPGQLLRRIAWDYRRLAYTQVNIGIVYQLVKDLSALGRTQDAERLLEELNQRFVGLKSQVEPAGPSAAAPRS